MQDRDDPERWKDGSSAEGRSIVDRAVMFWLGAESRRIPEFATRSTWVCSHTERSFRRNRPVLDSVETAESCLTDLLRDLSFLAVPELLWSGLLG